MLPEEFFLGEVAADPLTSGNISLTGDCLPEGVSRAAEAESLVIGWLTLTGNRGETLRCLPCKALCGALTEFRTDLVGEDGSDGKAPGAAASTAAVFVELGPVGVGGSTSTGGLLDLCEWCPSLGASISAGCVEGAGVLWDASSFFVSCGELAPCIPRPWASGFCSGLSWCLLSLSPFARGVSTASSKASYCGVAVSVWRSIVMLVTLRQHTDFSVGDSSSSRNFISLLMLAMLRLIGDALLFLASRPRTRL